MMYLPAFFPAHPNAVILLYMKKRYEQRVTQSFSNKLRGAEYDKNLSRDDTYHVHFHGEGCEGFPASCTHKPKSVANTRGTSQ